MRSSIYFADDLSWTLLTVVGTDSANQLSSSTAHAELIHPCCSPVTESPPPPRPRIRSINGSGEGAEPIADATSAGVMPRRIRSYCSRVNRPRGPDCHQITHIATARQAMSSNQRRRGNLSLMGSAYHKAKPPAPHRERTIHL